MASSTKRALAFTVALAGFTSIGALSGALAGCSSGTFLASPDGGDDDGKTDKGTKKNGDGDGDDGSEPDEPDAGTKPDARPKDSGTDAPVTVDKLYYGACSTVLAAGSASKVFSFLTKATFTPETTGGGRLTLSLHALKIDTVTKGPPAIVRASGTTGLAYSSGAAGSPNVETSGRYSIALGAMKIPADANPISTSEISISDVQLRGKYASTKFCAQLSGKVIAPLQIDLLPAQNTCVFVPVADGDTTPGISAAEFSAGCPN